MELNETHIDILSVLTRAADELFVSNIETTIVSSKRFPTEHSKTLMIIDIRYSLPELSAEGLITVKRDNTTLVAPNDSQQDDLVGITTKGTLVLRKELQKRVSQL